MQLVVPNGWRLVALIVAGVVLCGFTPQEGRRRAQQDLARHRPHWYLMGFPAPGAYEFERILHDDYGVELEFGGCIGPRDGADAYNAVIRRALERRYGRGVLGRAWARAQAALRHAGTGGHPAGSGGGVITEF